MRKKPPGKPVPSIFPAKLGKTTKKDTYGQRLRGGFLLSERFFSVASVCFCRLSLEQPACKRVPTQTNKRTHTHRHTHTRTHFFHWSKAINKKAGENKPLSISVNEPGKVQLGLIPSDQQVCLGYDVNPRQKKTLAAP